MSSTNPDAEQLAQAEALVIRTGHATPGVLQRKLRIGYPLAVSLLDQLEQRGVVGPPDGSLPRQVIRGGPR